MAESPWLKYSLVGENAKRAVEMGLVEAEWFTPPVDRKTMRTLLERRNGPAIRDTLIWFGLIAFFGYLMFVTWGTWWFVLPFLAYSLLYGGSSDSRSPESVAAEVSRHLEILRPLEGGLVFAGVHNIQASVPPENIVALFDTALNFSTNAQHQINCPQ